MDRNRFLAGSAVLAATSFGGPALLAAQGLTTIRIASAPDEDILGALYGQQAGYFQKVGLTVDVQPANNGSAVAAAVVGGSIDIGKSSMISLLAAFQRGIPIVIIAPAANYNAAAPTIGMLVAKDSPIHDARDLNGKTLSVSSLNDQFQMANELWVDVNGGDSKTLKFVELPTSAAPDAVADGRVAASTIVMPNLARAVDSGKCRIVGRPFDAIGRLWTIAAYFTTRDYATKNRDLILRFRTALFQASAYVNAHPAETAQALATFTGTPLATVQHMTRTTLGTTMDAKLIEPLIAPAVKYGLLKQAFDPRTMIYDPGSTT